MTAFNEDLETLIPTFKKFSIFDFVQMLRSFRDNSIVETDFIVRICREAGDMNATFVTYTTRPDDDITLQREAIILKGFDSNPDDGSYPYKLLLGAIMDGFEVEEGDEENPLPGNLEAESIVEHALAESLGLLGQTPYVELRLMFHHGFGGEFMVDIQLCRTSFDKEQTQQVNTVLLNIAFPLCVYVKETDESDDTPISTNPL